MRCCGGLRVHAVAAAGDHHRCRAGVGGTLASEDDAPEDLTAEQLARSAARRFNDVDIDDYYAAAVGWMLAFEITTGCTGDSFCAHDLATRRHFVTFLWRAAGSPKPEQAGRSCSPTSKPATTPTTPLAGPSSRASLSAAAPTTTTSGCSAPAATPPGPTSRRSSTATPAPRRSPTTPSPMWTPRPTSQRRWRGCAPTASPPDAPPTTTAGSCSAPARTPPEPMWPRSCTAPPPPPRAGERTAAS